MHSPDKPEEVAYPEPCSVCSGDCSSANPPVIFCPMKDAPMTNITNPADAVEVIQSDRDAAADVWRDYIARTGEIIVERNMRKGGLDEGLPTIFARHRLASSAPEPVATTQAPDAVEIAEIIQQLRSYACKPEEWRSQWELKAADALAVLSALPTADAGPVAWMYEWKPWGINNAWQRGVALEDPRPKGLREYRNVEALYTTPPAPVDRRYTSQTCPECGTVKPKTLAERVHRCDCGYTADRDVAAAQVILNKAVLGLAEANVGGCAKRSPGKAVA